MTHSEKNGTGQVMTFEFATAGRIVCGPGKRTEVFPAVRLLGTRVLIVGGKDPKRIQWLTEGLGALKVECEIFSVPGEPRVSDVEQGARLARACSAQAIVALGGGSAIDAGKAIAALAKNGEGASRYLEVIGEGEPLLNPPLPVIALPTTAGTGAEVTRNAVLASP